MVFSLLTLTHNRDDHLRRLLQGVERSTLKPSEIVVVYMNQADELDYIFKDEVISIRTIHVTTDDTSLPLAKARNVAAEAATNERLIFLDVDCIPRSDMFETLLSTDHFESRLVMGTPRYLTASAIYEPMTDKTLQEQSVAHHTREHLEVGVSDRYDLFWSLCFGLAKKTYRAIEGFDAEFIGYGGEDTDFAFEAESKKVPFVISSATSYHQHHSVYKPPVQHVHDIVINSRHFYEKWGKWPMEGWLTEFAKLGYIEWSPDAKTIKEHRLPSDEEMSRCEDITNAY